MKKTIYPTILVWSVLAVATGWAQTVSRSEPDDPAKPQVRTFELVLKEAVESGGRNFAKRAADMVPVGWDVVEAPVVDGVLSRVGSQTNYVFHVQVPNVWPVIQVMNVMMNRGAQPQRIADARVQAGDVLVADPLGPAAPVSVANKPDLEREYAMNVRTAIVDAVLDNAASLPLTPADTVLVFASGSDYNVPNPLYKSQPPRKLVLSAIGSDLIDYRQGKITREEAKQRIRVSSF